MTDMLHPIDPDRVLDRIAQADDPRTVVADAILTAYTAVQEYDDKARERIEQARRYRLERDEARAAAIAYEQTLHDHRIPLPPVAPPVTRVTTLSDTQMLPGPVPAPPVLLPEGLRTRLIAALTVEPERETEPARVRALVQQHRRTVHPPLRLWRAVMVAAVTSVLLVGFVVAAVTAVTVLGAGVWWVWLVAGGLTIAGVTLSGLMVRWLTHPR